MIDVLTPASRSMGEIRHVAVAIPLAYREDGDFWGRDAGLLVRGFRELGYRASLVALAGEAPRVSGDQAEGLALGTPSELSSPEWWKNLEIEGAVLYGWGLRHFSGIREAMRASVPHFAEHMDTDGMRSPRLGLLSFFYLSWAQAMARRGAVNSQSLAFFPAALSALAWTAGSLLASPWRGRSAVKIPAGISNLLVESPLSKERISRWLHLYGFSSQNVHLCPASVEFASLPVPGGQHRPPNIVAVGRWTSFQKNLPTLWKVAQKFVETNPGAEFHFVGEMPGGFKPSRGLFVHGRIPRDEIGRLYAKSRILIAASRYESFHLAAAEALCCGCSVVLPESLPTAEWFASVSSGTVALSASHRHLLAALDQENSLWNAGARSPETIASHWREVLCPEGHARRIISLWEEEAVK